jgi:hypothetical protein
MMLRPDPFPWMIRPVETKGLTPADWGLIVYDANQGVCWLADANLAGNPLIREKLGLPAINPMTGDGVNPDGTMDYATALVFVKALNDYNNGQGFLGHNNWQLPDTPLDDNTCSSFNNGAFGVLCTGSALSNLYYAGLNRAYPNSIIPDFANVVWPFHNLQPSLYWTSDLGANNSGEVTFSFNTDLSGANTTRYNYFPVLPMALGPIGKPPEGTGVLPYTTGPAAWKAVYDTHTGISWPLDANLAAVENFGVTGSTSIIPDVNSPNGKTLTVPLIDQDGAMLFDTANGPWIAAMNKEKYAGTNDWALPALSDLTKLFTDLNLQAGADPRLEAYGSVGPFWHLQPSFYWACERDQKGSSQSPCDLKASPAAGFAYSFDFEDGFMGTDLTSKQFYVMVYYPAP